jgi:perosamine synthetase
VALKLAGVGPGDEVLVSALSYIATTNAIFWQGARPVFCDVDAATLNVAPADAAQRVTARTRAFLVADYCGYPPDYAAIEELCARHGLVLVVDGAQALGGSLRGVPSCARGLVATTSFHTAKAFLTGEGGMVFVDDEALLERGRRLRGQGEIPGRKYVHDTLAYNYRMTDLAAAIGRVQVARMDEVLDRRRALVDRYAERLGEAGVELVEPLDGATISAFSLALLLPGRDDVAKQLNEAGVETRSLYPMPTYRQPIPEYAPYARMRLPRAEEACRRVLNPPLFYELGDADVDRISGIVASAVVASATASRAR